MRNYYPLFVLILCSPGCQQSSAQRCDEETTNPVVYRDRVERVYTHIYHTRCECCPTVIYTEPRVFTRTITVPAQTRTSVVTSYVRYAPRPPVVYQYRSYPRYSYGHSNYGYSHGGSSYRGSYHSSYRPQYHNHQYGYSHGGYRQHYGGTSHNSYQHQSHYGHGSYHGRHR